jgi:hypothetical protein
MGKQRGMRGLMSEEAETCFVLPLREAVAHFARQNTRSTDAKMGCSDNGNAHTSINIAAGLNTLGIVYFEKLFKLLFVLILKV